VGPVTPPLDPVACAALLILAFVIAGLAQTAWFASDRSRAFALPLDGGLTLRGRRLFGHNKTVRGLVVMVPAAAMSLPLVASALDRVLPSPSGLWPLTPGGYAALGAWSALGFMLGELPNSFVKRQLDIAPGAAAGARGLPWQLAADRLDSGIGLLLSTSLVVPVPWGTWALVLGIGPIFHWCFSFLLFRLGLKPRPA
jgi:CDP-2,3-bis-(O-geranylgeranyl)-sn-glycerol synthase